MRLLFTVLCLLILSSGFVSKESLPKTPTVQKVAVGKSCRARPIVIAVIDTGYGIKWESSAPLDAHLCQFGHKDFTNQESSTEFGTTDLVPKDSHGHGTHIAGIIDSFAKQAHVNYCIVVLKYYEEHGVGEDNLKNTVSAINHATAIHADYINYSGGGMSFSKDEQVAVKNFLDHGGKFIAAAGNEGLDLGKHPYYPAMDDDRVIVVGNGLADDIHEKSSNYGKRVNFWEIGKDVKMYDMLMSGTSQAAAIRTGKMVAATKNSCK